MEPWRTHIKELSELPNVSCKLSGVVTEADHQHWTRDQLRPYLDHVIDCFGFARLMYGSDWPVSEQTHRYPEWVAILDWVTGGCSGRRGRESCSATRRSASTGSSATACPPAAPGHQNHKEAA